MAAVGTAETAPFAPQTTAAGSPWSTGSQTPDDAQWLGWSSHPIDVGGRTAAAVVVVRDSLAIVAGWTVFCLATFSLWWLYPRRVRDWALLLCGLALAALAAPMLIAPLATTLLLAACAAALLTWRIPGGPRRLADVEMRAATPTPWEPKSGSSLPSTLSQLAMAAHEEKTSRAAATSAPATSGSSTRRNLLTLLLIVAASAAGLNSWADDPPADQRKNGRIFTVLVPTGKDRQPSGDTWYVPLELYRALTARAAAAQNVELRGGLTTSVNYRGRLEWKAAQTRLEMVELAASYSVTSFARQTRMRIPLGRDGVALLPEGAMLDGRRFEPTWDEKGRSLLLDLAEPGDHKIQLSLKPPAGTDLELATPPLPTAKLELSLPDSAPAVEVASALGPVTSDAASARMTAQLGGADTLAIQWAAAATGSPAAPSEIDQLVWLKLSPGAVTLEARLIPRGFEGRQSRLTLRVDPCLRVLGADGGGPVEVRVAPGSPQTVTLESARGFAAGEEVTLSLLWNDASGLGNLRLPLVAAANVRTLNRWLAVSVDKSLKFTTTKTGDVAAAPPDDLPAPWQATTAQADRLYQLAGDETAWSIATEPHTAESTAEASLALSLAADVAEVRYLARIDTDLGSVFAHRLRVPREMTVSKVELTQDGEEDDRVARWSLSNGVLTIFLARPVSGRQRLAVRGDWPLPDHKLSPPAFELEGCRLQGLELAVFRQPGVELLPIDPESLHELSEPTTEMLRLLKGVPRWFGRQVGLYRVVNPQAPAIFNIRAVPAEFAVTQITSLARREGAWQAVVDCRLHVSRGTVDTVRFLLPPALRGPLQISPEEPFAIVDVGGQRQLVVRPREPVRDRLRLTISGPLALAAGERVAAPAVQPIGAARLTQFVALPRQVEQERVQWELRGLERQPLPADDDSPPVAAATMDNYRAVGPTFQAALGSLAGIERAPRIRLADIRLALGEDGQGSGIAGFDLEPAGLATCVLTMPPGVRPLCVTVGSQPVALTPVEENRWALSLISPQLTQRVEVVFAGSLAVKPGVPMASPWLAARSGPLEVARTLWTVYHPRGTSLSGGGAAASPVGAREQQWQRLASADAILSQTGADESAEVLARWYQPWACELAAAWREIARSPAAGDGVDDTATALRESRRRHEEIAARLHTRDVLDQALHAAAPPQTGATLWQQKRPDDGPPPVRIAAAGAWPELSLESRSVLSGDLTTRLFLGALLCGAIGLLIWPTSSRRIADRIERWPQVVAAAAALLAWLVLAPGYAALVLAIAVCFAARQALYLGGKIRV
jgi:hypothetical protein